LGLATLRDKPDRSRVDIKKDRQEKYCGPWKVISTPHFILAGLPILTDIVSASFDTTVNRIGKL